MSNIYENLHPWARKLEPGDLIAYTWKERTESYLVLGYHSDTILNVLYLCKESISYMGIESLILDVKIYRNGEMLV